MPFSNDNDLDFEKRRPSVESKALRINLNPAMYGTFAEIGGGQEVARNFFRVGAASGTIAKTISAYDKNFSDDIYGEDDDGRYVTEVRLEKMLNHEMKLLEDRISRDSSPDKLFFTYANTFFTYIYAISMKKRSFFKYR